MFSRENGTLKSNGWKIEYETGKKNLDFFYTL